MKKFVSICALLLVVAAGAKAEENVYGPYTNYKGHHQITSGIIIPTTAEVGLYNPVNGNIITIKSRGGQEFWFDHEAPIFEDSYIYWENSESQPFDPDNDYITLTEIIAYDNEPNLPSDQVPSQRGFNSSDPECGPTGSTGYFEGNSGTHYNATIETVTVGNLQTRLGSLYDVSPISGDPGGLVYLMQTAVPAYDFVCKPFEFTFEYLGWEYIGGDYPYKHSWCLNITQWDHSVDKVSDIDVQSPYVIPGYVEVIPPSNWAVGPWYIGRYSYQANPNHEITVGGGTYGWEVNAKTPYVGGGHAYLTKNGQPVSPIVDTMVVASGEPNACGDWGYLDADSNGDCTVDLIDLAETVNKWLACSDPDGQGCEHDTIVGIGMAFSSETDNTSAAKIAFLYDEANAGIIEPNDIIVEYQGFPVGSGAELLQVIEMIPDPNVGDPVTMKVIRNDEPMEKVAVAKEIPVNSKKTSGTNKRCAEGWITPSTKKTCQCIDGSYTCACAWQAKRDKDGKVIKVRQFCADTGGNVCRGDWITVK